MQKVERIAGLSQFDEDRVTQNRGQRAPSGRQAENQRCKPERQQTVIYKGPRNRPACAEDQADNRQRAGGDCARPPGI